MKNEKLRSVSEDFVHFDTENEQVRHDAFFSDKKRGISLPELNPQLAALHAAHKGMHPVIFTVLAALHEIS
jgi:hypothetical protein